MDFKLKKSELNFRVYTAPSFPATGTENDICIKSEVPMTNWVMSPDKPSGIPRTDGDVWIQYTVAVGTVNILKNSTMMIATIYAWQYVDGAWKPVEAATYNGSAFVPWIVHVDATKPDKIETYNSVTYTIGQDSVTVNHSGTNGSAAYFAYKADLTNIKTVRVHFTARTHYALTINGATHISRSGVGILDADATSGVLQFWDGAFLASTINSENGEAWLDVHVESLSGEKYVWVGCYGVQDDRNTLVFDSIELIQ